MDIAADKKYKLIMFFLKAAFIAAMVYSFSRNSVFN